MDPDAAPVMLVALSAPRTSRELTEYADRVLRRRIESLNGVGGVNVLGGRARQINVVLDPGRLQSFGLTATDVQRSLASQNVEVPGGNVDQGATTFSLRVMGRVASIAEMGDLVVATRGGLGVRIRDVGRVEDGEEEASSAAMVNGRDVVMLSVRQAVGHQHPRGHRRAAGAHRRDAPRPAAGVPAGGGARRERVRPQRHRRGGGAPGHRRHPRRPRRAALPLERPVDPHRRARDPDLDHLDLRLIKAMGLTLNVITMLALTLAVGIVIDDAIVVLENIFRFIDEKGVSPRRAAVLATKEIGLAVLATTLSLIAVFLPVAFMGGIVGRFMASFGFTMSFAIGVSLLVSFTLTPMLSARWLKPSPKYLPEHMLQEDEGVPEPEEDPDAEFSDPAAEPRAEEVEGYRQWSARTRVLPLAYLASGHAATGIYGAIEGVYLRALAFVMRHRWVVGLAMVAVFLSTIPLVKVVQKNFLPLDDESRFDVSIRAPEGMSLAQTQLVTERMAREIRQIPGVQLTVATVGSPPGDPSGRGSNQASLFVRLVPANRRADDQQVIMGRVRTQVVPRFAAEHLRVSVSAVNAFGSGSAADSAAIQYVLKGPDLERLGTYSQQLLERVRNLPGVVDADTTLVTGKPELRVRINRARAADLGVSALDIANTLRMLVGGVQVSNFNQGGEQYEVWIRAAEDARITTAAIEQMTIPTAVPGRSVRLADVVEISPAVGPASIQRLARQRIVTVYANVVPGTSEAAVIAQFNAAREALHMDAGFTADLAGRSKELGRAGESFALAFIMSLVFMYLVLAAQFESWIHPVTILISLPMSVPFAVFSLVVLGQSMNIFSTLGILVLFGIVKKNSILQVDHMRDLRRQGLGRADAVMIANRDRLRPILMTTVAFVAGMIPLAISSGAGSGTNRAMSSVIIGGQTLSLALTLLATPVVYSFFDDLSHSRRVAAVTHALAWPVRALSELFEKKTPAPAPFGDDSERTREHNIPR
jgi:HAE1 family hydrophobic/amphiphilic exporter-1